MQRKRCSDLLVWGIASLGFVTAAPADSSMDSASLEEVFRNPPADARPLTWWHWLNGNVTASGITADLESMKRIGLGGCYLFNCGGKMPDGDARFMQPKWLEMIDHTLHEAERLGLKFGVHNCDGFSQSGGPWIKPEVSMKELVWTATDTDGPATFDEALKEPRAKETFYRDVAVVAFPLPEGGPLKGAKISGTLSAAELKKLTDGKAETQASIPVRSEGHTIVFEFDTPQVLRSLTLVHPAPQPWEHEFPLRLETSEDGISFRDVGVFTANWDYRLVSAVTNAFPETTGRVFRISFRNAVRTQIGDIQLSSAAKVHFAEAKAGRTHSRGHGAETPQFRGYPGPDRHRPLAPSLIVARDVVRDLTSQMQPEGRLRWEVPAGRWRILRVGYTSNGHYVSPATPEGRGLECDKLDPATVRFHLDQYAGKLIERAGPAAGRTFAAVEIDSWECGVQNWTKGLETRYRERVGYDLLPFLPAMLEGWIVGDADLTERFLWDWRRFLADELSRCYFAQAARYFKEKGVTYVGESTGRQQYLYDVAYMRNSDVTMGEFWINTGPGQGVRVDNKLASSIAHVAGKRIVASESYTASPQFACWQNHPFTLKPEGDRAFCAGVNQFVFHTFAHQVYPATGPGFTFFYWGLNFNRANTWWDAADGWMQYLTRCNHLLRQGQQVCDVLWFVGEDVPNRIAWRDELKPVLPAGYDFDGCDIRALLDARVKNGLVVLPSGATYRLLLLPDLPTMRPNAARKVVELVQAGATALAPRKPLQSPALLDRGAGDEKVRKLTATLWGDDQTPAVDRQLGKGRFLAGLSFEEVFRRIGLPPDFQYQARSKDPDVLYVHRRMNATDLYFISNQRARSEEIEAVFRANGKAPEFWDPSTGAIARPGMFRVGTDGRVTLPVRLDPNGSVFAVFRATPSGAHAIALGEGAATHTASQTDACTTPPPVELGIDTDGELIARFWDHADQSVRLASGTTVQVQSPAVPKPFVITGPWKVTFPEGLGAPESAVFEKLVSWTDRPEPGIRFFSGTATYTKDFDVDTRLLASKHEQYLDLGEVQVIARVALNAKELATLWKPPFRVRVDGVLRPGMNHIEIKVTNLWPNRMIGDSSLPDDMKWQPAGRGTSLPAEWPAWLLQGTPRPSGRITFCTRNPVYTRDDPLLPSGLVGPVCIRAAAVTPVTAESAKD